eukprot:Nk52_evm24s1401 gene=Nk52_evmTU24s1401
MPSNQQPGKNSGDNSIKKGVVAGTSTAATSSGGGRKRTAIPILTNVRRKKAAGAEPPPSPGNSQVTFSASPTTLQSSPRKKPLEPGLESPIKSVLKVPGSPLKKSPIKRSVPTIVSRTSPLRTTRATSREPVTSTGAGEGETGVKRKRVVPVVTNLKSRKKGASDSERTGTNSPAKTGAAIAIPKRTGERKRVPSSSEGAASTETPKQQNKSKRSGKKGTDSSSNVDVSKMTMKDLIYYNPKDNLMKAAQLKRDNRNLNSGKKNGNNGEVSKLRKTSKAKAVPAPVGVDEGDRQVIAPQVKIGADGRMILNEESLVVSAGQRNEQQEQQNVVYESSSHVTYYSYSNRTTPEKWTEVDTRKFYRAISKCGTDFSLIEMMFPNRSRKQIKSKFKKEERTNRAMIERALSNTLPIEYEDFKDSTELSTPI